MSMSQGNEILCLYKTYHEGELEVRRNGIYSIFIKCDSA